MVVRFNVFRTQTPTSSFNVTIFDCTNPLLSIMSRRNIIRPINQRFFKMVFFSMFRIAFEQFKIFYPIISSYTIYMVNSFFFCKFSTKMLFHNISVLKNSCSIYKNTKVTTRSKMRLAFFKEIPIRRNIVVSVSKHSTSMHLADLTIGFFKYIFTPWNFTYITNHYPNNNGK